MKKSYHFDTLQIHAGYQPDIATGSCAVPIHQTTSYVFRSTEHAANIFSLKEEGNIYTRITNPTTDVLEQRLAALEGGCAALATSSGHAAQFIALITILKNGDNFISSPFLYGGTYNQFKISFRQLGINVKFSSSLDPHEFESLIDKNTKAIYLETIGNPGFMVPDFTEFSLLAAKYGIPLIVDNTFGAGGYFCQPIKLGADIVVASTTKWIGGHGTSMGGIIADGGHFNWNNGNFPHFTEPSEGYHGLKFWETYRYLAFIYKARTESMRDFGPCISPFNSFQLLQGLETLSVRAEKHAKNTLALANWLYNNNNIEEVNYPGLPGNPAYITASKYLKNGYGGVLTFKLKGGKERASAFINSLNLVKHLANVGDVKTLIIQPAATTHQQMNEEELALAGITPNLIRVSVGLEHIDDIIYDFEQAIEKSSASVDI